MPKRRSCPSGKISRKGYTRSSKTGKRVHVKRACIANVGLPGKYSTSVRKELRASNKRRARAIAKLGSKKIACPAGTIARSPAMRKSFTRKSKTGKPVKVGRTTMRATCIQNRGAPGKGQRKILISRHEHFLSEHGYKTSRSSQARHAAIKKVIASGKSPIAVRHMLLARSNLLSRTEPNKSKVMYADQAWVKKHFGGGRRRKSRKSSKKTRKSPKRK